MTTDTPSRSRGPRLSRRQLLRASAALGALAAAGTGGRAWHHFSHGPEGELAFLNQAEADFIDALAEALFPPGGEPALSGGEAGVSRHVDLVLADMPAPTDGLLRLLLGSLNDWSRLTSGRAFASLSLSDQQARLQSWMNHPVPELRSAISGLILFVAAGYCGHPDVRSACGWVFPCGYER